MLRVLTARATQKLLLQLQELDLFVAQWLNNYCSEHKPMEGNTFISGLMGTPGSVVRDPNTGACHTIGEHLSCAARSVSTGGVGTGWLGWHLARGWWVEELARQGVLMQRLGSGAVGAS